MLGVFKSPNLSAKDGESILHSSRQPSRLRKLINHRLVSILCSCRLLEFSACDPRSVARKPTEAESKPQPQRAQPRRADLHALGSGKEWKREEVCSNRRDGRARVSKARSRDGRLHRRLSRQHRRAPGDPQHRARLPPGQTIKKIGFQSPYLSSTRVSVSFLQALIPEEPPEKPEDWETIMDDVEKKIMIGVSVGETCTNDLLCHSSLCR